MIYIVSINKYTLTKKKIEADREVIETSSLDTLFNHLYQAHGFEHYDLHFLKKPDKKDYLYRIKITARYKNEMEFLRSEKNESRNETISNFGTLERSKSTTVGNIAT